MLCLETIIMSGDNCYVWRQLLCLETIVMSGDACKSGNVCYVCGFFFSTYQSVYIYIRIMFTNLLPSEPASSRLVQHVCYSRRPCIVDHGVFPAPHCSGSYNTGDQPALRVPTPRNHGRPLPVAIHIPIHIILTHVYFK